MGDQPKATSSGNRTPPVTGDASFGLDPSADVDNYLEGRRWLPNVHDVTGRLGHGLGSNRGHHHHHHHHHHGGSKSPPAHSTAAGVETDTDAGTRRRSSTKRKMRTRSPSRERESENGYAASRRRPFQQSLSHGRQHDRMLGESPYTERPSASVDVSTSSEVDEKKKKPSASSHKDSETEDEETTPDPRPTHAPTGSLTGALFSPGLSLSRRLALLSSSMFINLFLPFVNGAFLGLGEIAARGIIVPLCGIGFSAFQAWIRRR